MIFQSNYAVCVGRTIQDDYYRLDRLPEPGNKVNSIYVESRPGGGMANTTCALSAYGSGAYLVGPVGDDFMTEDLLSSLTIHGVDVSYMYRDPGQKNFVHEIFLYEDERIIMLHRGEKPLSFVPNQKTYDLIDNAAVLYSDVQSFGFFKNPLDMLTRAKARGTHIFIDGEPGSIKNLQEAETYFSLASILSLNDFALKFYAGSEGEDKVRRLIGDTDKIVLLTRAKHGVTVMTRDMQVDVPAYDVPVVDTTGAGDTFNGAFAAGRVEGLSIREVIRFANAAAALSVGKIGAQGGMPWRKDVEDMLSCKK